MGLREASVRHPNVVVMAPALTETAQSQNFKFTSSVSLSLKDHAKRADVTTNGMNGHDEPPLPVPTGASPVKTTLSINGLVKNLPKNEEFLPLKGDSNGFTAGIQMGLVKSNNEEETHSSVNSEINNVLGSTDLEQVDKILEAIQGTDGFEFEKDLFDVDVISMCVDDNHENKDSVIGERLKEDNLKRIIQKLRKTDILIKRAKKLVAKKLGCHVAENITDVIEYTNAQLDKTVSSKGRQYDSTPSKPLSFSSMSLFMRQMEHTASQQLSNAQKSTPKVFKYFGSGSSSNHASSVLTTNGIRAHPSSVLPPYEYQVQAELENVSSELSCVQYRTNNDVDSEATESSSGDESADEFSIYNNPAQQHMPISNRALWKYREERALAAARWTWLQTQIADLDYTIRLKNEQKRVIRNNKGEARFEGDTLREGSCARSRPLIKNFPNRKILRLSTALKQTKKPSRPLTIQCTCRGVSSIGNSSFGIGSQLSCALCAGRGEPTLPRDQLEVMSVPEKVALIDHCYHPVLSLTTDISPSYHYNAIMSSSDWQNRASKIQGNKCSSSIYINNNNNNNNHHFSPHQTEGTINETNLEAKKGKRPLMITTKAPVIPNNPPTVNAAIPSSDVHIDAERSRAAVMAVKHQLIRRRIVRGKRRRDRLSMDRYRHKKKSYFYSGDSDDYDETDAMINEPISRYPSPVPSPASAASKDKDWTIKRKRENEYDIDNIVIPYSMASSTRVEKLTYKEILTPKWRMAVDEVKKEDTEEPMDCLDQKNGIRRSSHEEGYDDMSDEVYVQRHDKCEIEERKKFLSYLKVPNTGLGPGRGRHKRTDSRAESSGPNTPDPMSPSGGSREGDSMTSPPATPLQPDSEAYDKDQISGLMYLTRRRTISASKAVNDQTYIEFVREVPPYQLRTFPLNDETHTKMLSENSTAHQNPYPAVHPKEMKQYLLNNVNSPTSLSTDSADSYQPEDPNDPEWHTSAERSLGKR